MRSHEGLVRVCSAPIDTTEVLLIEQVENAATTIHNNRMFLEKVEKSFHRHRQCCTDNNAGHFKHLL